MVRTAIASLVGALVVFGWGSVSWLVLTWHLDSMTNLPGGDATFEALKVNLPESGVYMYPPPPEAGADEATLKDWSEKYSGGPYINMLVYRDAGYNENMATTFIKGYALDVVGCGLIACLLFLACPAMQSYARRVMFVLLLAVFASVVGPLIEWNYWQYPADFAIPMFLDGIIAWTLAGLVIAAIVKPKPVAPE